MDLNKLLHPELLPHSELLQILESLCVRISPDLPRSRVLEIFKRIAVPLPQRSTKSKTQSYTSYNDSTMDSNTLPLPYNKRNMYQLSNNPKKLRFDEASSVTDIKRQLDNVQLNETSVIFNHTSQNLVYKTNTRKVDLKRAYLFRNDDEEIGKRIKLY